MQQRHDEQQECGRANAPCHKPNHRVRKEASATFVDLRHDIRHANGVSTRIK